MDRVKKISNQRLSTQKYFVGIILILIFSISVIIRLCNLNRPLDGHQEWLTSTVLRNQCIWYEEGELKYKFCPIMTYNNKADRNINNQASNHKDAAGNFYYTSYPPFAYIFPYLIFKSFKLYPDVLPLQIFNLIIHFICCFFIFLIISLLTRKYYINKLNIPAIFGFSLYLFSPETLWYHSNVYMADILVQVFFIIGIYIFLKIILITDKNKNLIYYFLLGLNNFFIIYTEWLGVFFAFSIFLYTILNIKKKKMKAILYVIVTTTIASLTLTFWQYSQISTFDAFIKSSLGRYLFRSGLPQKAEGNLHFFNLESWRNILFHYAKGYFPILIIACTLMLMYIAVYKKKFTANKNLEKIEAETVVIYLCIVPVILHHVIFFNFTSLHDSSVLKTGVFIAIIIALFYHKIIYTFQTDIPDKNKILKIKILNSIIILMIIASIGIYVLINDNSSDYYKKIGKKIAKIAKNNETIFINSKKCIRPQLIFYAHRNMANWENETKAKELLNLNGVNRGIIFTLDENEEKIVNIEYVNK